MRKGRLKIGDMDYALQLLSSVHGEDARRPVKELVENAADSEASQVLVVVNKKAQDPYIMCKDNGEGISRRALMELPENVCNSIKRRMQKKTGGVHGIGLLSFMQIGDRLRIISRSRTSADTNALELHGLKEWREMLIERPLEEAGTEVYIYGIDKSKKLLDAERLVDYLGDAFANHLIEGKFKLEIQQDGKKIPVTHERLMSGTPIIDRTIATPNGDIVAKIFYGGKGGVTLSRRGITVERNIASLPEIESEVWKSGKINGSIGFDAMNVSTDKRNPVRDDLFRILMENIRKLEPEILESLKNIEEKEREESSERLYRYLASRFDEVLKTLHLDRIKTLMETRRRAEQEALGELGQGSVFGSEGKHSERRSGKPPLSRGDHKKRARTGYGINWQEESDLENPKSRSRFDSTLGVIYINKVHPDYMKRYVKAKNDLEKLDYIYKLGLKEIVLHHYDDARPLGRELFETLIDLQFAMEKNPPVV
jgi:hypothetical protein